MIYDCGCYDTYLSHSFLNQPTLFTFSSLRTCGLLGTKPNTCEVIKTYSVRGKEKKGRIRELWRVAHLQWNLWFQRLQNPLPLGGMMEVHASAKNAFFWNSYKVPLLGLHVRLPAGTGRFQLFEDWKLMWKPFHLCSRWWLNSSFWDHLGVWTLQIVGQTTCLNWYRFSAVASSMPGKVRWNRPQWHHNNNDWQPIMSFFILNPSGCPPITTRSHHMRTCTYLCWNIWYLSINTITP